MGEFFKKGSIVAKRLGLVDIPRKARHQVVFNCNCIVVGKVIMPLKQDEVIFLLKAGRIRKIKYIRIAEDASISTLLCG